MQDYPDLARGDSNKSIFLLVEIDSVRSQLSSFLSFFTSISSWHASPIPATLQSNKQSGSSLDSYIENDRHKTMK